MAKRLSELKANKKNPRTITPEKLDQLKKALAKFGDLSGIIYNRTTKQIVGGHQRVKIFGNSSEPIKYEKVYKKPTKTGTIAEGYVRIKGERFGYREVVWNKTTELAANLAANRNAGEWDDRLVSEMLKELDESKFDLSFTMFGDEELQDLLVSNMNPNFEEGSEDDQGKLDKKKPIECPHCGEEFVVGYMAKKAGDEEE